MVRTMQTRTEGKKLSIQLSSSITLLLWGVYTVFQIIFLDQPESALFGIKILVGLIPGIAMLLGALIYIWYPLKGKYLQEVQSKVLEMHAEKKAKLLHKATPTNTKRA